mmetsp:Transcript_1183/g.1966  ORF Transcript_1183/g.1966 Transcript_1183/m.1966 type:complete len:483 (-) Transcript_1183:391-1839(-)
MSAEASTSASNAQGVFVYMGQGSVVPRDVTRVHVHHSVRVIAARAFSECYKLVEVELCEGLEEIGEHAFCLCPSLRRITVPSSVRSICGWTFKGCRGLVEVELCEGLEAIGEWAFEGCISLRRITIPSSVRRIGNKTFAECTGLVEVELCEGLEEIRFHAFRDCKSLRNIAIPPTCRVGYTVFDRASALKKAFPSVYNFAAISEALKHRFDVLPIHQLCYYQHYHPTNNTLQHLEEAMGTPKQPNITGTQQDCLGMTPLHILACSTKHDMDLYRLLIEKYPNNLITEDKWGDLPILYAFWGNAPRKVVQFLIESHETYSPDHILDWGSMIVSLGEVNATDSIWNLMQQNHFPDQTINWEECAMKLARSQCASIETFQLLLWLSVANRLDALGVGKWKSEVENLISECPDNRNAREGWTRLLYSNLTSCEQLKDATWLLELTLWKAKINEGGVERYQCRINCGVQEILPNVFSFLLPTWESNP